MYVAYGWPRTLSVKADNVQEDVVHLSLNDEYLVVVSTVSVQIWSGDQHRVMLGQLKRDAESIAADGLNRRAVWCASRKLLAVLVSSLSTDQRLDSFMYQPSYTRRFLYQGAQSTWQ
jgi:hypothetical protein